IDTGSQITAISITAARTLGLSETLLAGDRPVVTQGVAAARLQSRVHRFEKLEIGAAMISKPEMIVTDLKLDEADMVLGMDLLASRRLWLSYESRKIFLSN
ncbi:MAG TPA: aspartyl protease family protein, partial [Candidatus Bathyarchaeia archaeon]|nr:aspartyl protease family protein [Candidatus Bathyarchaeia archaeon]